MRFFLLAAFFVLPFAASALRRDSTVTLTTPKGKLYGTLTLPVAAKPIPLVIILAGSGPTDRDGNQPQNNLRNYCLLALGDSLGKAGIASFRYDKRGVGASKAIAPDETSLRFDDYVKDAVAWVKKWKADKRFSGIYIAGHSEGSLIGMLVAQKTSVNGFISMEGMSVPADSLLLTQLAASSMFGKPMVDSMRVFFGMLRRGEPIDSIPPGFYRAMLRKSVQPYLISWVKYNPANEIARLRIPMLIVHGTTDVQIDTTQAHALMAASKGARLVMIENMNHMLKKLESRDPTDTQFSYMDPGFLLHPELTPAIVEFISSTQKKKKK